MRTASLLVCLLLSACWGRDIAYEGGTVETGDTAVVTTSCGDEVDRAAGLVVEGVTLDLASGGTVAAGLCISAVDPTPALSGETPIVLATSVVCDDGSYVVGPVTSVPSIGMFVVLDDCDGATEDTVLKTATGIPPAALAGLGAGDTVTAQALSASVEWGAIEQADLEAVGWSGDLATNGYMAGIVEDSGKVAVSGATVACKDCVPTIYYEDGVRDDGIYGADSTANVETEGAAGGIFMIPGAPIFSYTCADGGTHTWESTLLGSLPGYAVYIRFTAH